MHQRKSKQIFIYLFLLFLFGSITNTSLNNTQILNLEKVIVSGLDEENNRKLIKKINNLKLKNIFFLNENKIKEIIETNNLVENYKISKIYPSTLDIKINKTKSLAKINQNGQILFLGSNGKFSETTSHNKILPFIFGNPKISEFLYFKKIIDDSKFSYDEIKNLYFFPSKRWDIELNNSIFVKLPKNDLKNTLNYIFNFLAKNNLKYNSIIDARIENQIVIND